MGLVISVWILIASSVYVGAYFSEDIISRKGELEKQAVELKTEMANKVEILGEHTVKLHDKLKRCLDEKFQCDCED